MNQPMNLNELRDKAYKTACDHGFHDKELSNEHWLCLVVSELMEAVEADRKSKHSKVDSFEKEMNGCLGIGWKEDSAGYNDVFQKYFSMLIKDSVEDELSDAFIRLLDLAGARNLNLNRFCLQHVVTERKTFTENIYAIIKDIMNYKYSQEEQVNYALSQIRRLSEILKIDLPWHIDQKMKYNQSRERLHGKKY